MAYDGSIKFDTSIDTNGFTRGISKMKTLAKSSISAVSTAIGLVTTGLLTAGAAAINTGIQFESAFAGVVKTVDATDEELSDLKQSLIDMSKEIPQSASDLAAIAEAAGQLGIETENIEAFTEVMANLGVATNMTSDEAATELARLANITGMSQTDFDKMGSTIVALGNNLATTESEIVAMSLRIAGAGNQVGMTEEQIMAFSGALSSVGIEAEMGGSAFSTLISKMSLAVENGEESLTNFADVAGMSADEFKKAFKTDATSAIMAFLKGLNNVNENGGSAIKTLSDMGIEEVRMRDTLLRASAASDTFTEALDISSAAWKENTALTNEAEKRYETLESKIQLMKNSLSALGIAFKDSIDDKLRSAVETGTEYINRLSDAFTDGGLEGAVAEAGNIFGELVTKIAEYAPDMIEAAISFIKSFVQGINDNREQIISAVKEIVSVVGDTLLELLPSSISYPISKTVEKLKNSLGKVPKVFTNVFKSADIEDAISTVIDFIGGLVEIILNVIDEVLPSFEDGLKRLKTAFDSNGFRRGVEQAKDVFKHFGDIISNIAKSVIPIFTQTLGWIVEHLDILVPLAETAVKIWVSWKILQKVKGWAENLSGAISGVADSMKGLNLSNSIELIFLVAEAVIFLTERIADWYLEVHKAEDPVNLLTVEQKELRDSIYETRDSYNELKTARDESYTDIESEYGYLEDLAEELGTIVDDNGKIKEGYEDRASFIIETLNGALDTEITKNGNIIQNYSDIKDGIYDIIEAKKAQAYLDANQDLYNEAIKNQTEALQNYTSASNDYQQTLKEIGDTQKSLNKANDNYEKKLADLKTKYSNGDINYEQYEYQRKEIVNDYYDTKEQLEEDLSDLKSKLGEQYFMLSQAETNWVNYATTIQNYEDLSAAIISGNTEKIGDCLENMVNDFQTAETGTEATLSHQVENMKAHYEELKTALKNGTPGVTQEMVNSAKEMVDKSEEELKKFKEKAITSAEDGVTGFADTLSNEESKEKIESAIHELTSVTLSSMDKVIIESAKYGSDFAKGFAGGIKDGTPAVGVSAVNMAMTAGISVKKTQKSNSPSKVTRELGNYFTQGYMLGIADDEDDLIDTATTLSKNALLCISKGISDSVLTARVALDANTDSFIGNIKDKLANSQLIARLKSAVAVETSGISMAITGRNLNNYSSSNSDSDSTIKASGNIETHISIDGREFAVATVPYFNEELAFAKG